MTTRIAMWSGPRNISTALMRSFENRPDTRVIDEPLYAHYLSATGLEHPGRDEILRVHETDWRVVTRELAGDERDSAGETVYYQKHMTHHLLDSIERDWIVGLTNVFLIREPAAMLISLDRVLDEVELASTGLPQQLELFRWLEERLGQAPLVLDAADVLENPKAALRALCDAVELPFLDAMLTWEPGPRETDGVWAPHWYSKVQASTGFGPPRNIPKTVPPHLESHLRTCREIYEKLRQARLRPLSPS